MMEKKDIQPRTREIDLIGLARKVLGEFRLLCVFVGVSLVLGVIVALSTPKSYTSMVVLAPEISGAGSMADNLSDLASMVGVKIGSSGSGVDAIYPEIYPDILASPDFIVRLFDVEVEGLESQKRTTYYNHLLFEGKMPFWDYPMLMVRKLIKKIKAKPAGEGKAPNLPYQMDETQYEVCTAVRGLASCLVDKKTSVITLTFTDQDPKVAATMVDTIQKRIQQYITAYRTQKARNDYDYAKRMYEESYANYKAAQEAYARYSDTHKDMILESHITRRDELENNMQLRFNVYNQFAQQLSVAQAKIQERTPAFTVLQSASIPVKPSNLPRRYIVAFFVFLGVMADAAWVLFLRDLLKRRKTKV
ncbi:MAG: chain-length determining protein [Bacteroidaceae bacterium]|nr:chain-length determining protein [Prevotellaceae bacterium]MDY5631421.1 chain-length determining protein [Bacteroidaceae bacterium]